METSKKKVFLVEDDTFMVSLLVEALAKEGFDIAVASDGAEAVTKFQETKPDVAVFDVLLPKQSGIDALEQIRKLPGGNVPALILSNIEDPADVKRAQGLAIKAYLVKANMDLSDIVAAIKAALAG